MKSLIECHSLGIGYKQKAEEPHLLFPTFDIQLYEGELTALVGPNGAGKTSLIKTISGNLTPLSGWITLFNKTLKSYSTAELATIISIVLTDRILDQHIKVYDVVATGRYPYTGFWATLNQNDKSVIQKSLEMVGAEELSDRTFVTLSDGERQKVMIAKALAQDTPIILLDEPAAFLDYPSKIELMHLLQNLVKKHHKTILYSSHDLDLVLRSADRLWLVASRKPIATGIPEQLVLDGLIEDYFAITGLHFDAALGQFILPTAGIKKICVSANGITGIWLRRALERKGWTVNTNENEAFVIKFGNNNYILENGQTVVHFANIESLITELDSYENN
jgi:iron complex transport system ATP-binding protein